MAQLVDLPPPGKGTRLNFRGWPIWIGWVDLGMGPEYVLAHEITPGQGIVLRNLIVYGDVGSFINAARGKAGSVVIGLMLFAQMQLKEHVTIDMHPAVIQNDEQFTVPDGAGGTRDMNSDECCGVMNTVNFEWQKLSDLPTQAWPQLTAKNPDDPP